MWPFNKKYKQAIKELETLDTKLQSVQDRYAQSFADILTRLSNIEVNLHNYKQQHDLEISSRNATINNSLLLNEQQNKLTNEELERLKEFLGIINYVKTPQNKVLFSETSLLKFILDSIKQINYQQKKHDKTA